MFVELCVKTVATLRTSQLEMIINVDIIPSVEMLRHEMLIDDQGTDIELIPNKRRTNV